MHHCIHVYPSELSGASSISSSAHHKRPDTLKITHSRPLTYNTTEKSVPPRDTQRSKTPPQPQPPPSAPSTLRDGTSGWSHSDTIISRCLLLQSHLCEENQHLPCQDSILRSAARQAHRRCLPTPLPRLWHTHARDKRSKSSITHVGSQRRAHPWPTSIRCSAAAPADTQLSSITWHEEVAREQGGHARARPQAAAAR